MSITDYIDDLELAARTALAKTGAIKGCPFHSDVTIRVGDVDAERHAYALATTILKSDGTMWMREDVMPAIKDELDLAEDECPQCANLIGRRISAERRSPGRLDRHIASPTAGKRAVQVIDPIALQHAHGRLAPGPPMPLYLSSETPAFPGIASKL
jgi:hypothetical protein